MDKIAISSTKYVINGKFEVNCFVDKPDIIGSFFGQTEGLIGDELEFQNLQKTGKLGRIDIILNKKNSKTTGKFKIPTSLDKIEVSLVAAAIESVDKIGAGIGKIKIINIEDVRIEKRKQVSKRAEELLLKLRESIPLSSELSINVSENISKNSIVKYGNEVYGGPNIKKQNEIILVEGRADVLNLLKHGISNVLSFGGNKISNFALKLIEGKNIILFLDGDSSGKNEFEMIKEKIDIEYYIFAPEGYCVEDLNFKMISKLLKNKKKINMENEDEKVNLNDENLDNNIFMKLKNIIIDKLEDLNEINIEKNLINKKNENKNLKTNNHKSVEIKKSYLTKKQYDKLDILIKEVKKNNNFIILNKDFKNIKTGNITEFNKLNIINGKILVFNGVCENSIYKKAKDLKLKLIICNKKAKLKLNDVKIKLFDEFTN